jgi:hypothetical protein
MKKVFILLLLTLSSVPILGQGIIKGTNHRKIFSGSGSFSFVQQTADAANSTANFTRTLNGTVAGNMIIVVAWIRGATAGALSVSDGTNGSYTNAIACQNPSQTVNKAAVFYFINGAGGNLTITTSYSGTYGHASATAYEYSSTTTITFDLGTCTASPGSTSSPTSDSITTTGANDLLIGGMMDNNASGSGCGAGWGHCGGNTDQNNVVGRSEDKLNQATGSYSAAFTLTSSQSDWTAGIAAFKD